MPDTSFTKLFERRQLAIDPVELITYEVDAGFDRGRPDGVLFAESATDVQQIMRWANSTNTPLIARGAGTGLSGGAVAGHGGIIVEFARMDRVVDLSAMGRAAIVEPGVVNLALDEVVKKAGLYFPPDPSSQRSSQIGGNLGENAGGPHCFKYGVTTNYITGLEVVLADGRLIKVGGAALDYPDLDLCGVFVGSEGTLGLVTRAFVRLIRNPPGVRTMMVAFESEQQAGIAVSAVIASGLVPATLEMMDQRVMRMIEAFVPVGLPVDAGAALIVEVDGHLDGLDAQMEEVADILTQHKGYNLRLAESDAERQQIWYGRKSAAGAFSRLAPAFYLVDITVPRSRLVLTLSTVNQICDRYNLIVGHVFHAGDGNLHPAILFDPQDHELRSRVFQACDEIVSLCVEQNGSITGEHGVGIEKRAYMPVMYSGAELAAMLEIKDILDPRNLLNPGKIFPDEPPVPERVPPDMPKSAIFAPGSAQEAAAGLAALASAGQTVRIGSAAEGNRRGAAVWLTTERLDTVHEVAPSDLYVTAGAGMRLDDLQEVLCPFQMQVPVVAPWPEATLGGLLAANINSPLRMRYGSLRDLLLAVTVAMADGRVIRAGRPVVKNVAGYDITKLFIGAYGALGLLVDATLKLVPLARARRSLAVYAKDLRTGLQWAETTVPHWLATSGVVLCQDAVIPGVLRTPYTLLFTAEGTDEDITSEFSEIAEALANAGAPRTRAVSSHTSSGLWANFLGATQPDDLLVRVGIPPGSLSAYLDQIPQAVRASTAWCFDVAGGLAYAVAAPSGIDRAENWLNILRRPALELGGYAIVMQVPDRWREGIAIWGYEPEALDLMKQIKARWDPAHILNPGDSVIN